MLYVYRPLTHNFVIESAMLMKGFDCRSQCGYRLMACSLDGTLAYLEFTIAELGKSMTDQEKVVLKFKLIANSSRFLHKRTIRYLVSTDCVN